ncbi:MAG: hypothetical protein IGBAC_0857 [Ignavibacteriae bacterium]|nr:MAG: hypothetical protein IGBAC_0857 [Ignavibacteriota bacterium]
MIGGEIIDKIKAYTDNDNKIVFANIIYFLNYVEEIKKYLD